LPLAQQWNTFSDKQQSALLLVAKRYPTLTPAEKQRVQKKLTAWSKLTPEQRKAAREKYRTLSQNPIAKNEQAKRIVKQKTVPPPVAQSSVVSSVPIAPISAVEAPVKN
jgi:TRAP-type mannitol/chloroaromatic compound transport system substrate-binding protein